ncbi:ABC transporter substrate-binding protein [Litorivicinus lipolyticus]|uniref:ABC transporter substrate-binding protein n=1 Tax=Litorivicinus lipolyticus TaxID=418701 RepID=UPI003B59855A
MKTLLAAAIAAVALNASALEPDASWAEVTAEARGQSVFFNAWGGSDLINDYLMWVGERVQAEYGVTLEHVKVGDIAEIVTQLESAKAVGRDRDGNVDLMWINGENFANLKANGLTWGAFAGNLPNAQWVADKPSIAYDFSVPVDGLESPWGGAQLVFIHDSALTPQPPRSSAALKTFVENGGRFSYPAPPAFHGTTFLKQVLAEVTTDADALLNPVADADFDAVTAPLWSYLDAVHPLLRGQGKVWPASGEETRQLLDDGEVDIAISFNPNEASAAVRNGQLPDSARTYIFDGGTIGNTHFVSIPFNAKAKAGAMVVADFLLSPEAQARKADPTFWGDPTVLDLAKLPAAEQATFAAIDIGQWALPIAQLANTRSEPHASWAGALEAAWAERYAR